MIIRIKFINVARTAPALSILFILVFFNPVYAYGSSSGWSRVVSEIEKTMEEAMKDYKDGKVSQAMEKVADAYFGVFEGEQANMEIAVRRHISLKKAAELEKGFGDLRKAMSNRLPLTDIKRQTADLIESLKGAARELERKGVGLEAGY